jgi:C4-dicarboxylate transporter, DctM subunit
VLVFLTIAATVWLIAYFDPKAAPAGRRYSMREKLASLKVAGPLIFLFVAVTGVIYLGIATPTEAAGLGATGALVLSLWLRKLNATTLTRALYQAASTTCMIFLILMGARVFGYFFTLTQITQNLIFFVEGLNLAPWVVLVFVLALYFVLGCFMDQAAILVLTVPVLLPLMLALGYDPIWFGVIVIVMAEVGLVTPPLGLNVFVVSKYTGRPLQEVFAGVTPHIAAHLVAIALMCIFPEIVLWLPSQMY